MFSETPLASQMHGPGSKQSERQHMKIHASPDSVRNSLESLRKALSELGFSEDYLGTTELVLAEALNNIVEHAYAGRSDGQIRLDFDCTSDGCAYQLKDEGVAMPGLTLPKGKKANLDVDVQDLPEGGFGWSLIHMLTENLHYQRNQGENRLTFQIPSAPALPV